LSKYITMLEEMMSDTLLADGVPSQIKSIFIFGSSLYVKIPNDIDILIIYQSLAIENNYNEILDYRNLLADKINYMTNLTSDIIILSEKEYFDTSYYKLSKKQIYPH